MSQKIAIAIRHVAFEDCGTLEAVLRERGVAVRYIEAGCEELWAVDASLPELLIGLGGPVSVYEADRYPWILGELALFERRLALNKPVLGICLGAQMLAHVLGARVFRGDIKEIGWKPLTLTRIGKTSVVSPLASSHTSMFHWHGDTFDLPAGAQLLASTAEVPHQIFRWSGCALGFQCHPEFRAADIESWLIGHACELAGNSCVELCRLRCDTTTCGSSLEVQARAMFGQWFDEIGL